MVKFWDFVFNGYPRGTKGYKMLEVEPGGSKFIKYICITFSESRQGKKGRDMRMELLETMEENIWYKMKAPTMDTSSNDGTIT